MRTLLICWLLIFFGMKNGLAQGSCQINIVTTSNAAICYNGIGTINISATGGTPPYTYSINGVIYQPSNTIVVGAGTYTVYVKDNTGCVQTTQVTVTEPSPFTASASVGSCSTTCAVTISTSGGTAPFQYSSDGISFQSSNVFNLAPGMHTITVMDANNCTTTVQVNVQQPCGVNASIFKNDVCSGDSALVVVSGSGGVAPYMYAVNGGSYQPGNSFLLPAGTHMMHVRDSNNCEVSQQFVIDTLPASSASFADTACVSYLLPWGVTVNVSGSYNYTYVNQYGCDSVVTAYVTVWTAVSFTDSVSICSNQLPYQWNGNSYTSSGTYMDTLVSQSGCDSIVTLELNVNNVLSSTENVTICSNQLPYQWNGNSYTAAGTYMDTLVSQSGCDSIITLQFAVNPTLSSTENVTICSNQLPYLWNGNSYNAAGTYLDTLVSQSGCDSIVTLQLNVNNVLSSTENVTICSNQLPYQWNGNSYTAAGTYMDTLVNQSGCDSIITLQLTVNPTLSSTENVTICSNQLPYLWNGNSYTAAGTYLDTLVSQSGCDSVVTLQLNVNATLSSTENVSICSNQLPYQWNGNSYTAAGTYMDTLVSQSGCDSIVTLQLNVNNVLSSTENVIVCANQLPYQWNGNSYTAAGTYIDTLVSQSGCDSIVTLQLNVNSVLSSTENVSVCSNQLPYQWNGNSYTAAGTYLDTLVSQSGCDSVLTLQLNVNATLSSTENVSICSNQLPYQWNGNSYTAAGSYMDTLVSQSGCDSVVTLQLNVNSVLSSTENASVCSNQLPYLWNGNSYTAAGTYIDTLVSQSGCDSVVTLQLNVNNVLSSTENVIVCANQLPYQWNGNSYTATGTYIDTLVSQSGCDSIVTLQLNVNNVLSSAENVSVCSNQLPYQWNGNSYTAAGTYMDTLVSQLGCDSIITLQLAVNPTLSSTENVTICSSQLPYQWNGNNYTATGTYMDTLVSQSGCDSVVTLQLNVNSVLSSTESVSVCSNQLPYQWNGNSYTAAGTYMDTLVSQSGCDSVVTLQINVNATFSSTENVIVCSNQLPYQWNGNNYTAAGTYMDTLMSQSGCDSVVTLQLNVNSVLSSTENVSICSNQLPYQWNGNNYTAAGTYLDTLVSQSGCDSVVTLQLSVNATFSSTENVSICSSQLPYQWNGNSYTAAGTYIDTLVSQLGCDSIITLQLGVNPTLSSTENVTICSSQLPYQWNGNNYTAAGTYMDTLVSQSGCDSVLTLQLNVNATLSSTENASICSNQLPYHWNGNSYTAAGTYLDTLVSQSGCDSVVTLQLNVNATLSSTENVSICSNQLPYQWNGNSYTAAGTYMDTLVSQSGCDSVVTLQLSINAVQNSYQQVTTCAFKLPYVWNGLVLYTSGNYSATLTSSSGCDSIAHLDLTIVTEFRDTTSVTLCASQLPYSWNGLSINAAGYYHDSLLTNASCDSIKTLHLVVITAPHASFLATAPICKGESQILNIQLSGTAPWSLSYSDGTATYTINNISQSPYQLTVQPGSTTTYSILSVTDANCSSNNVNSTIIQQVHIPVPGIRYPTKNASPNLPMPLAARDLGAGAAYLWMPATGLNTDNIMHPVFQYHQEVEYLVRITDPQGCITTDTLLVKMALLPDGLPDFYIPDAFTPNGDGRNDLFYPIPVKIRELKYFRVFNRWGELVFETATLKKGWNGEVKGKSQRTDVFVWMVEGTGEDGRVIRKKGTVMLIR